MSAFEAYDRTSRHYDRTREAIGGEIILRCLARHEKPLDELVVLDAGCGTGAYSRAIVDRVGRIEAIDLSQGMLAQARRKLTREAAAGRIRFCRGAIDALPFPARSLDAVMINQVVHHLGDSPESDFPRLRKVVAEFARVLPPGGVLLINHCAQAQLRHGFWHYHLIPRAAEAVRRRCVPLATLRAIMEAAGFVNRGSFVPHDDAIQGATYLDGRGPLRKEWRDGDSIWALVDQAELDAVLSRIRALDAAGQLTDFVAEHDARRPEVGQITFLFATRA